MEDLESITTVRQLEWLAIQLRTPVLGPQSAVLFVLALATLLRFLLRPQDAGNRMRGTQSTCKLARSGTRRLQGQVHDEPSGKRTCRAQHRQNFFLYPTELSLYVSGLVLHLHERQTQQRICRSSYKNSPCYELAAVTAQTILVKSCFWVATAKLSSTLTVTVTVTTGSYCNIYSRHEFLQLPHTLS